MCLMKLLGKATLPDPQKVFLWNLKLATYIKEKTMNDYKSWKDIFHLEKYKWLVIVWVPYHYNRTPCLSLSVCTCAELETNCLQRGYFQTAQGWVTVISGFLVPIAHCTLRSLTWWKYGNGGISHEFRCRNHAWASTVLILKSREWSQCAIETKNPEKTVTYACYLHFFTCLSTSTNLYESLADPHNEDTAAANQTGNNSVVGHLPTKLSHWM